MINVKLFKKSYIKFESGLNLIQGSNSAGKSSIVTIISWIFWGSKRGINNILRRGEDHMKLELIYTSNNKKYKIIKKYNIKDDTLVFEFLEEDKKSWRSILNSKMGSKQVDLKNLIESTIEIKESTYMSLLVFSQKKFYNIIYGGSSVKTFLDYILNITQINHLQNIIKDIEKEFKKDLENEDLIQQNLKNNTQNLAFIQNEYNEYISKIDLIKKDIKKLKEQNMSNIIQLKTQSSNITTSINDILIISQNMITFENNIRGIMDEITTLLKTDGSFKSNIKSKLINKRNIRKNDLIINELQKKKLDLAAKISSFNTQISNSNTIINNINVFQDGTGICPTCKQVVPIEHITKEISKEEKKIKDWTDIVEKQILQNDSLESNIIKNRNNNHKMSKNVIHSQKYISSFIGLQTSLFTEILKYRSTIDTFDKQYPSFTKKFHEIITQYNMMCPKESYIDLTLIKPIILVETPFFKEINDISIINEYNKLFDEITYFIREKYSSYEYKMNEKQQLATEYLRKKDSLGNQISIISDTIAGLEKRIDKINIIKKNQKIYLYIQDVINRITTEVRDIKIKNLERLSQKWYEQLVTIPQFTTIKIDSENYAITIYPTDAKHKQFVELSNNISGGNETLLAIAERLALLKNIKNPIIFLDEPTDGTDKNNIATEIEGLAAISNIFPQIFLITHHKIGSQYANNVIILKKNEKKNITTISSI